MKKIFYVFSVVLLTSCASTTYYQMYNVKQIENKTTNNNKMVYEDDNCIISYNLWSNGGNIGFNFYNKTDVGIFLNLNKCNFVFNGIAYDYYKNRTYTKSQSSSASETTLKLHNRYEYIQNNEVKSEVNTSSSFGYSVSIKEDTIVYIPAKTSKIISEYSINNTLIRNCDLLRFPYKDDIKSTTYTIDKSPIIFSNIITYTINGVKKELINKFYVSKITNYPETEFVEYKDDEYCGQKSYSKIKYFKFYDKTNFFLKYNKGSYFFKH